MKLSLEIRFRAGFEVGNICSNLETSLENNLFENWRLKLLTFTMFSCANMFPTSNLLAFNSIWTWKHLFEVGNIYCELGKTSGNVHKTILKTQLPQFQPFSRMFPYPRNAPVKYTSHFESFCPRHFFENGFKGTWVILKSYPNSAFLIKDTPVILNYFCSRHFLLKDTMPISIFTKTLISLKWNEYFRISPKIKNGHGILNLKVPRTKIIQNEWDILKFI